MSMSPFPFLLNPYSLSPPPTSCHPAPILMRLYSSNIKGFCFYFFVVLKKAFKKHVQNNCPPQSWKLSHPLYSHITHPVMDPNSLWPDLQPQPSPDKPCSWLWYRSTRLWELSGNFLESCCYLQVTTLSPSKKGILFLLWSLEFFNLSDLKFPLDMNWK